MSLALTPAERTAFAHLWSLADPRQSGVLVGDQAVKFFAASRLPPTTLGQVWAIADSGNVGFLTPSSFGTALRLIAHAQQGQAVTPALASSPTTPPAFDGISYPSAQPPPSRTASVISAAQTNATVPASPAGPDAAAKSRFARIFANSGPVAGLLDGVAARDVFLKSKLPVEKLAQVWSLADTHSRGALDLTDFTIAMYYIQASMNGSISALPASLPPGLYEQISGGHSLPQPLTPVQPPSRGYTPVQPHRPPSVVQRPPSALQRAPSRQSVAAFSAPVAPQRTGTHSHSAIGLSQPAVPTSWDITPAEQTNSSRFFDSLDTGKTGQVRGALAVPFFLQSKLDEATLARVWDLADVTQTGSLSREEFAVAMHLINRRLAGTEVPHTLPPSLVPPSLRNQAPAVAVNPQTSSTQQDMFVGQAAGSYPFSTQGAFPRSTSSRRFSQASTPFDNAFDESVLPSASRSRQASIQQSFPVFDPGFDSSFAQPAQNTAPPNLVSTTPAPSRGLSVVTNIPPSQPLSPQPLSAQPPSAKPLSPDQTVSVIPSAPALGRSSTRAALHAADRPAPESSAVFLDAAERELEKVQAQRAKIQEGITSDEDAVAEMRARLNVAGGEIDDEQKLLDDLTARAKGESEALDALKVHLADLEKQQSELRQEKHDLLTQMGTDKAQIATANEQMQEVQSKSAVLAREIEALKGELAKKKEAEGSAAAAAAAATAAPAGASKAADKEVVEKQPEADALIKQQNAAAPQNKQQDAGALHKKQVAEAADVSSNASTPAPAAEDSRAIPTTEARFTSAAHAATFSPVESERNTNPFGSTFLPNQQFASSAAPLVAGALAGGAVGHHHEFATLPNQTQSASAIESSFDDAFGEPFNTTPSAPAASVQAQPARAFDPPFEDAFGEPFDVASTASAQQAHAQAPDVGQALSFDEHPAFRQPAAAMPHATPQMDVTNLTSEAAVASEVPRSEPFVPEPNTGTPDPHVAATVAGLQVEGAASAHIQDPLLDRTDKSELPEQKVSNILATAPDFATAADEIEQQDPAPYTRPIPVQVQLVSDPERASDPPEWGESQEREAHEGAGPSQTAPADASVVEGAPLPVAEPQSLHRDLEGATSRAATSQNTTTGLEDGSDANLVSPVPQGAGPLPHGFDNDFDLAPIATGAGLGAAGAAAFSTLGVEHRHAEPNRSLTPSAAGEGDFAPLTDTFAEPETSDAFPSSDSVAPSPTEPPSALVNAQDVPMGFEGDFGVQAPTSHPESRSGETVQPTLFSPEDRADLPTADGNTGAPQLQGQEAAQAQARALSSTGNDPALVEIPASQPLGESESSGTHAPAQDIFDPAHLATGAHSDQVGLTSDIVRSPSAPSQGTPFKEPQTALPAAAPTDAPGLGIQEVDPAIPPASHKAMTAEPAAEPASLSNACAPGFLEGVGAAGATSLAAIGLLNHEHEQPVVDDVPATQPSFVAEPAAGLPSENARPIGSTSAGADARQPAALGLPGQAADPVDLVAEKPTSAGPVGAESSNEAASSFEPALSESVTLQRPVSTEQPCVDQESIAAEHPLAADEHPLAADEHPLAAAEHSFAADEHSAPQSAYAGSSEAERAGTAPVSTVPAFEAVPTATGEQATLPESPLHVPEGLAKSTSAAVDSGALAGEPIATSSAPLGDEPPELSTAESMQPVIPPVHEGTGYSSSLNLDAPPAEGATSFSAIHEQGTPPGEDKLAEVSNTSASVPNGSDALPRAVDSAASTEQPAGAYMSSSQRDTLGVPNETTTAATEPVVSDELSAIPADAPRAASQPEGHEKEATPSVSSERSSPSHHHGLGVPLAVAGAAGVDLAKRISSVGSRLFGHSKSDFATQIHPDHDVPASAVKREAELESVTAGENVPPPPNVEDQDASAETKTPAPSGETTAALAAPAPHTACTESAAQETARSGTSMDWNDRPNSALSNSGFVDALETPVRGNTVDFSAISSIPNLPTEPSGHHAPALPHAPARRSPPPVPATRRTTRSDTTSSAGDYFVDAVDDSTTPEPVPQVITEEPTELADSSAVQPSASAADVALEPDTPSQEPVDRDINPEASPTTENRGVPGVDAGDRPVPVEAIGAGKMVITGTELQPPAVEPADPLSNFTAFDSAFGDDTGANPATAGDSVAAAASGSEHSPAADTATRTPSTTKSRRAPPPIPKSKAETPAASTTAPAQDDPFGSSFASFRAPAVIPASSKQGNSTAPAAPVDDFAASFADFDKPFLPQRSSGIQASTFEDSFDNDFTFAPSFGSAAPTKPSSPTRTASRRQPPPPPVKSASAATPGTVNSKGTPAQPPFNLENSFSFDDSFGTSNFASTATPPTHSFADPTGFTFDDSFVPKSNTAAPVPTKSTAAAPAPVSQERPPTPAMADDIPLVKRLAAMGFSRSQVVNALELANYRQERALEILLGH